MNRQQAEHLLDAYVELKDMGSDCPLCAIDALREVILDVMTEYRTSTITVPHITYPQTTPNWGKTIVTCGVNG